MVCSRYGSAGTLRACSATTASLASASGAKMTSKPSRTVPNRTSMSPPTSKLYEMSQSAGTST